MGGLFVVATVVLIAVLLVRSADTPAPPEPFTNSVNLKMVKLEGGKFRMGSPDSEAGHEPDEGPAHEVTIRGPFFMLRDRGDKQSVCPRDGHEPFDVEEGQKPDYSPVDSVSWDDANEFCRRLTEKRKGPTVGGKGWAYRLPTEAEWEYACRAGIERASRFGDRILFKHQAMYRFKLSELDPYETGDKPDEPVRFAQRSAKRTRTSSAFTTCTATSRSGAATGTKRTHTATSTATIPPARRTATGTLCAAARSATRPPATRPAARDSAREPSGRLDFV